jgi:beta-lactamase superfamily II metal-dependent hydrolase
VVSQSPTRIDFRAYNVGFGDCLLLSFTYAAPIDGRAERHVLIDFGSNKAARGGPSLKDVAALIDADTNHKLDVLILTHRHRDHLAGFDPAVGGATIARLAPDIVVRPWTEVPDGGAPAAAAGGPAASGGPGRRKLLDVLAAGHQFASNLTSIPSAGRLTTAESALMGMATMQLGNDRAIKQLDELASAGPPTYLKFGDPLVLDMLPGVSVSVLGPPEPDIWPAILHQAASSTEYWLGAGSADPAALADAAAGHAIKMDGDAASLLEPGPGRWLIDRLDDHLVRSAERLVHQLDSVLNNTSLVLLVEAAGHRLLLPGDAEIENWGYALTAAPDHAAICDRLMGVDLYKVGHHGSRNATPKQSLYPLLAQTPPAGRMALMSTLVGFYGTTNPVPNQALIDKLSLPPFTLLRTDVVGSTTGARSIHVAATPTTPFALAD